MRIVTTMGYVYRLSERRYRQLLRAIMNEEEFDLDVLGTRLADQYNNITDVTAEEAADELKDLRDENREARRHKI